MTTIKTFSLECDDCHKLSPGATSPAKLRHEVGVIGWIRLPMGTKRAVAKKDLCPDCSNKTHLG